MIKFNFSLSALQPKKRSPVKKDDVIARDVTGKVITVDGVLKCYINNPYLGLNGSYFFAPDSHKTFKRKTVYFRGKDKYGHRIKIIRDKESRISMNKKFYSAIADGLIVRGNLIKDTLGIIRFHVIVRYNPSDVREISDAYKEYEEYINKEKEVNTDNGVCPK